MCIQTDLRVMVHIVTSMKISMIAAPKTKLNMPKFISIQTDIAIYLRPSRDRASNANESLIAILISLLLCPNCSLSLLHCTLLPRAWDPQGGKEGGTRGWQSLICAVKTELAANTCQGVPWGKSQLEEPQ